MGSNEKYGVGPGRLSGLGSKNVNRETASPWEGLAVDLPVPKGAMKEAGILQIWTSILRRQNMVAQFIATRPILDLYEGAVRRLGDRVTRRWWEQTGIDWKGAREKAAATEEELAEAAEPELTSSDSKSEADTPEGTACGTGEEAYMGARGSSGSEWSGAED